MIGFGGSISMKARSWLSAQQPMASPATQAATATASRALSGGAAEAMAGCKAESAMEGEGF